MTALTQRQEAGKLFGSLYVDNHPIDDSFNRQIGYCQQMDIQDESSTIREAFEFSALLRQSYDIPKGEKLAYVETVLQTLDLIELQNAVIGSLDIEKKKRVTIGVELCARPRLLLFLDEPTSGLDSQGATSIVALLRRLADQGLAILCTIHQANQQQFEEVSCHRCWEVSRTNMSSLIVSLPSVQVEAPITSGRLAREETTSSIIS